MRVGIGRFRDARLKKIYLLYNWAQLFPGAYATLQQASKPRKKKTLNARDVRSNERDRRAESLGWCAERSQEDSGVAGLNHKQSILEQVRELPMRHH